MCSLLRTSKFLFGPFFFRGGGLNGGSWRVLIVGLLIFNAGLDQNLLLGDQMQKGG